MPGFSEACCDRQLREPSSAEQGGYKNGVQRASVYQCEICGRIDARGESWDPGWVNAKAEIFLGLRREAFELAGWVSLRPRYPRLVRFASRAPLNRGTSR